VFWKIDRVLRFFTSGGLYRRRGDVRGGPGTLTRAPRGQGAGRAAPACGALVPPSYSSSDLCKLPGKIRLQDVVPSNSENISCVSL
jgi:hypothetical protein